MPINPNLLIMAPVLQDLIVDKDSGLPLANGIVSLYQDTQRQIFKNWYYQTGAPGGYLYVPLANPLHLSSAGTIQDPAGNDVIPFYYPYDENDQTIHQAYYITVYSVDSNGNPAVLEFTRENFPFVPSGVSPNAVNPTLKNYILNNVYWRNIGTLNTSSVTNQIIAPSQHEGYTSNSDIRFIKSATGATDSLSFLPMTATFSNDITPEFYLNMQCTATTPGETVKCIQYPISLHINTLQNVSGTIVFWGQNVGGGVNNYVDIQLYQYLGTGALSQPAPVTIQRVLLNAGFTQYVIPFTFPSSQGLTTGIGGDDAFFLRVQYPLSLTFNINHTKPQLYLSNTIPDNNFDTYDMIESIINSPRTGDYRTSLNAFQPFGFVPCNDGTIGSTAASTATCRANNDTWPLYNLIWNNVLDAWAPVTGGRGANAYADFSANKLMNLTRQLGRVIAGNNPLSFEPSTFTGNSGTGVLTLGTTLNLAVGTPIQFTNSGGALPSPLMAGVVYYVSSTLLTGSTITPATTLDNAYAGMNITLTTNGSGTNTVYGTLGVYLGESAHTQTLTELVAHHHAAVNGGDLISTGNNTLAAGTLAMQATANPTTSDTGGGLAFNIIQPTMFANVFLKL